MEGSEIVVKDLAIGCHNFRIVTGNEERNCIAIPLNSALIVGFVGDVSSVIRRIEQQPVFEPLLLDALVNSLNKPDFAGISYETPITDSSVAS